MRSLAPRAVAGLFLVRPMPRSVRTRLFLALTLFASNAVAQDHLAPEDDPFAQDEYHAKIREVFADVLHHDILVQVLLVPSFQPEEIAGIRRSEKGFEAFASKPSAQIWTTFNIQEIESGKQRWMDEHDKPIPPEKNPSLTDMKKRAPSDYRQIHVHTHTRPISDALTERIRSIWQDMLVNARKPTDPNLGVDGEDAENDGQRFVEADPGDASSAISGDIFEMRCFPADERIHRPPGPDT